MEDQYFTIARESTAEIKIKNSRFIGETCLVESAEQALERLNAIRKREHAATHHCYGYRVGLFSEAKSRYSDDGEPNGTAGKPIFDHIVGSDLSNILLVVTRHYGGTNLGTGGLTHAYGEAARMVLDRSGKVEQFVRAQLRLVIDFGFYDKVQRLAAKLGATATSSDFSDQVRLELSIRRSRAEELRSALVELTSGKGSIEALS
ncbi:MAG: IMPACT family protein [candidate division Zixibacteria bacterium]|nr:IMPACT family protein [candidate division Zixibacteria bacterium]